MGSFAAIHAELKHAKHDLAHIFAALEDGLRFLRLLDGQRPVEARAKLSLLDQRPHRLHQSGQQLALERVGPLAQRRADEPDPLDV